MSEIKGQLLGILLVVMVFAAVGGAMVTVFTNLSDKVVSEVSEVYTELESMTIASDLDDPSLPD